MIDITTFTDDGSAVNAFWDSKDFEHAQGTISRWKRIEFYAEGGSCQVFYSVDGGDTWVEIGDSPYTLTGDMPTDSSPLVGYFDVVSSKIRIRFVNNAGDAFKLKQFILEYTPREQRR